MWELQVEATLGSMYEAVVPLAIVALVGFVVAGCLSCYDSALVADVTTPLIDEILLR